VALRSLALCAGIGGLDLGVRDARPDHRLVCAVERQAYCAAVLVARMAEAALDPAPVWSDVRTFDPRPWRGAVDLVTAGFPFQPVSVAGLRRGQRDERWLWPEIWRVARGVGCRYLFVENTPGLISLGLADILADLAACGWAAEWDCVPAASVGAPHLRDRFFLLAESPADPDRGRERDESEPKRIGGGSDQTHARWAGRFWPTPTADDCKASGGADYGTGSGRHDGTTLTDAIVRGRSHTNRKRREESGREAQGRIEWADSVRVGDDVADADDARKSEGQGPHRYDRGVCDGGAQSFWHLTPPPEPTFRKLDDGSAAGLDGCPHCADARISGGTHCARHEAFVLNGDWAEQIHALGNAVVRQAAARAWKTLEERLKRL